jgi:cytochrome c peroxidase
LFHDARENTLEQQVWGPLLAQNEMGNPSVGYVIDKIKALSEYQGLFVQSFNSDVNMLTLGQALASYQRSLVSANSSFDRWYFGKQTDAVSDSVKRGFAIFNGKGACSSCHIIESKHAIFTDNQTHNTGIGYRESMQILPEIRNIQVAPGVFIEVDQQAISAVSAVKVNDLGEYEITQDPQDRWKYKTPTLRNIALTAPYMHNGSLTTMTDVIQFYNQGGVDNATLDPLIKPLDLHATEKDDLLAFLLALTGSNVQELVADAYNAPIGN